MRLTTAITDMTPITTPSKVNILRSLCDQRLAVAIRTASPKVMDVLVVTLAICSACTHYTHTHAGLPKLQEAGQDKARAEQKRGPETGPFFELSTVVLGERP